MIKKIKILYIIFINLKLNYSILSVISKIKIFYFTYNLLNGDWGIGDWGLGNGDWAQSPIPNHQSPIPNPQSPIPI